MDTRTPEVAISPEKLMLLQSICGLAVLGQTIITLFISETSVPSSVVFLTICCMLTVVVSTTILVAYCSNLKFRISQLRVELEMAHRLGASAGHPTDI